MQEPEFGLVQVVNVDPTAGAGISGLPNEFLIRTDDPSIWYKSGVADTAWTRLGSGAAIPTPSSSGAAIGVYGNGSDGDVIMGAGTTALARDMFYHDLTVPAGATVQAAGWFICVSGTLTLGGTIDHGGGDGADATIAGPGVGGGGTDRNGSAPFSTAGGAGGVGSGGISSNQGSVYPSCVARGGRGGAGDDGLGGSSGAITATGSAGNIRQLPWCLNACLSPTDSGVRVSCSSGGGGGAGAAFTAQAYGGGGGGGGGYLVLCARVITGSGLVRAKGGDGGDAFQQVAGNSAGGGGGGGGGVAVVVTDTLAANLPTITAAGGAGGGAVGPIGTNGAVGGSGLLLVFSG
jgi:hypothetical protein